MEQLNNRKKLHCNHCLGDRWHTVLFRTNQEDVTPEDEGRFTVERTEYELASCNGCEYITLYSHWTINGGNDTYEQYPQQLRRRRPKWMFSLFLSSNLNGFNKYSALQEIYRSIGAGNHWLTVLGVRALLEHIMIEKVGDHRTFDKNLNAFCDAGFISKVQMAALEQVVEAGHAGMHRGFQPSGADIEHIMDILENVIESTYVSKDSASKLVVPPRIAPNAQ